MARLLRSQPPQPRYSSQKLPPRTPPFAPISVNLATGVLTNQRRSQERFPLQGFEQVPCDETGLNPYPLSPQTISTFAAAPGGSSNFGDTTESMVAVSLPGLTGNVQTVDVYLNKNGAPTDNLIAEIRSDSAGLPSEVVLTSATPIAGTSLTTSLSRVTFSFPGNPEIVGPAWLVIRRDGSVSDTDFYSLGDKSLGFQNASTGRAYLRVISSSSWNDAHAVAWTLATYVPFSGQVRLQRRFLGPRPPLVVLPLPSPEVVVSPPNVVVSTRTAAPRRRPHYLLGGPTVLAQPPPVGYAIFVTLAHTRPRYTRVLLPEPVTASTFVAPPLAVYCLQPDRLARRNRRQLPASSLFPPTVLQTFAAGKPSLVKTRPRPTDKALFPPTIVRTPSVEQREQTITTALVRTRPRPTTRRLAAPTALTVFVGPTIKLVHARPRPTRRFFSAPTVIRVPSVEQAEQTIKVALVRTRPRPTEKLIQPPIGVVTYPPVETQIAVALVRTRPPRTASRLVAPTALATFSAGRTPLVTIRPRPTTTLLSPPTVVRTPSVEQREQTITVTLVHARPRHTITVVRPPTVLAVFASGKPALTKTRPRPTHHALTPPTVVRVPSVEQQEDTIRVSLARIRPRHTVAALRAPTVLQTFAGPTVHTTQTRPRPTTTFLTPPTVVRVPSVEQQEDTIRVALVRTRPRPTAKDLFAPTVLQTFFGPLVETTRIRPRHTFSALYEPTVIRVPAVEQAEQTIRVSLVRIRPRPTTKLVAPPTTLAIFAGPVTKLVRSRPRPTDYRIVAPTVLRVPSVEQAEQTIRATLDRTRPRPTIHVLDKPTVLRVPSVEQREQTITVALVRTRPRPTTKTVFPPTVLLRPPVRPLAISYLGPNQRHDWNRHFADQGQRQRIVRETGTTVTYQQRDPFIGPRPPQIIDPLPTQRVQTISETLVAVRTRREIPRHTVAHFLRPPTVIIAIPSQRVQTIFVKTVSIRPRHTVALLRKPAALQVFESGIPALVRARPPKVNSRSIRPATLEPFSVELREQTVRVALVQIRPHPTITRLYKPRALQVFVSGETPLVHIRPPKTRSILGAPATLEPYAVDLAERTIRTTLVRTRPRRTISRFPQVAVLPNASFASSPKSVVTRPRRTHSLLRAPIALRPAEAKIRTSFAHVTRRAVHSALPKISARFVARPIEVALARSSRPRTHSRLAVPTVVATAFTASIRAAHLRQRVPTVHSFLNPPTVVATEPPVVTTLSVTSVAIRDRLKRHDYLHRLPLVIGPSLTAEPCFIASGHDRPTAISAGEESKSGAAGSTTSSDGASPPRTSGGGASGYSTPGGLAGGEEC